MEPDFIDSKDLAAGKEPLAPTNCQPTVRPPYYCTQPPIPIARAGRDFYFSLFPFFRLLFFPPFLSTPSVECSGVAHKPRMNKFVSYRFVGLPDLWACSHIGSHPNTFLWCGLLSSEKSNILHTSI